MSTTFDESIMKYKRGSQIFYNTFRETSFDMQLKLAMFPRKNRGPRDSTDFALCINCINTLQFYFDHMITNVNIA